MLDLLTGHNLKSWSNGLRSILVTCCSRKNPNRNRGSGGHGISMGIEEEKACGNFTGQLNQIKAVYSFT